MAKKKNKNKPTIDIDVEVDNEGGPPADPNVPDLPTPKIAVHVSNANNNNNANHNANANANVNLNGGAANKSIHLHHDYNHHHSHYARSVGQDSKGGEKVTETKEVVDVDEDEGTTTKTKTVKETTNTVAGGGTIKVHSSKAGSTHHPSSPVGSVKSLSHKNSRPPDIVVNIALPPAAAAAPTLAPAPAVAITPPTPIPRPPSIAPAAIPLPASVPLSPATSVRSLAPSRSMHTKAPRTVFAVPIKEDDEEIEETTVVTTTRKIKRSPAPSPPAPLPLPPSYAPPGTPLVVSDPTWKPVPEPRPVISRPPSRPASFSRDDGFVETTTVKTVTTSPKQKEKSSFLDKLVPKFLKPTNTDPPPAENQTIQVRVHPGGDVDVDVGTGVATAGNATTVGGDGARTVALGRVPSEPSGRKAGIRPIPIIDYKALITQSPPRRHRQPPPTTVYHSPTAPKTILTMSADLVPDFNGNPHYHARVRDHTGVHKPNKTVGAKTAKTHHGGAGGLDVHAEGVDVHIDKRGDVDIEIDEVETKRERKDRDRRERRERREPLYKSLKGAYPAPMSERYAMPPPLEDIQNAARERYERRAGFPPQMGYGMGGIGTTSGMSRMGGMGRMGMGGMPGMPGMGMGMGPPYPPPGPMTVPRPPPFMGQRPPMFAGNFPLYPTSGMGMPMNNSVMGMGMGQIGYGQGMPGWQGQGYGWQGNPRFPGRSGM